MKDVALVLQHFFNWRFFFILLCITVFGLTLPDRWIKPFRSVRFNIYLFSILAVLSSIGTFFPQSDNDMYHTWWFSALLALMAFDVIACKLRRLPVLVHGPSRAKDSMKGESIERFFAQSRQKAQLPSKHGIRDTSERVRDCLKKKSLGFEEKEQTISGKSAAHGVAFFAVRHRLQRWGDFILHVSIVAVLAGNLMGAVFGFKEGLSIPQGRSVRMKNRPYDVTLNDFKVEYYDGSAAPSLYVSDLVVREQDRVVAQRRIVVNDPLDIDRVRFYQASWGLTTDFHSAAVHVAGKNMELLPQKVVRISGTPLSIRANEFLPSFGVDPEGQPTTTDFEGKNPALQVDFLEKGDVRARLWLLKNDPHTAFKLAGKKLVPVPAPPFFVTEINPVLFSGIQVAYDPGAPLFWSAAIVLLIGLCMHFYMHQRRLRILIVPKGNKADVMMGGWNSRAKEDFEEEFDRFVTDIRAAIS